MIFNISKSPHNNRLIPIPPQTHSHRCDKPVQLLQQMKASLKPGGKIVIALVLPYTPFVEDGAFRLVVDVWCVMLLGVT